MFHVRGTFIIIIIIHFRGVQATQFIASNLFISFPPQPNGPYKLIASSLQNAQAIGLQKFTTMMKFIW